MCYKGTIVCCKQRIVHHSQSGNKTYALNKNISVTASLSIDKRHLYSDNYKNKNCAICISGTVLPNFITFSCIFISLSFSYQRNFKNSQKQVSSTKLPNDTFDLKPASQLSPARGFLVWNVKLDGTKMSAMLQGNMWRLLPITLAAKLHFSLLITSVALFLSHIYSVFLSSVHSASHNCFCPPLFLSLADFPFVLASVSDFISLLSFTCLLVFDMVDCFISVCNTNIYFFYNVGK